MPIRERDIEQYLVRKVKEVGGHAFKYSSPSMRGVPDRLVLLPKGHIFFVEVKAPGKRLTKLQRVVHKKIEAMGQTVFVIDMKEQVNIILEEHK